MGVANCKWVLLTVASAVAWVFALFLPPPPPFLFCLPVDSSSRTDFVGVEWVERGYTLMGESLITDSPISMEVDVVGVEGVGRGHSDTPLIGGGDSEGERERGLRGQRPGVRGQRPGVLDVIPSPPHSPRTQGFRFCVCVHLVSLSRERGRERAREREREHYVHT
jgi:hypothetical protein